MDQADERTLLRILARTEIGQTVLTVVLCLLLSIACVLLWANHTRLHALHQELITRNRQGAVALDLLGQAVDRLERRP